MLWYQLNKNQVANELETDLERGLAPEEAERRLRVFGLNQLPEQKPESLFIVFVRQFKSPLIYVLIVCAFIIYFLGEVEDSFIIGVILLSNALVGAYQEGRSQRTLASLKKLTVADATVVRGEEEVVIPERCVVPGDVLSLKEGQKVVADARVVFSSNLTVDESSITGESGGVMKQEKPHQQGLLALLGQDNMVFKGTNVLSGSGRAVAVGTGLNTEIGKISKVLLEPEVEIPLQKNIRRLSQMLVYVAGTLTVLLFAVGLYFDKSPREMFGVVVSMGVALIPEGLPLVLTLILVTGVWRMSKRNALVKKMQAVEALGHADVLATDKTGTLTRNEMVVKKVFLGGRVFSVTGNGYEPKGNVVPEAGAVLPGRELHRAATIATLVSRATVVYSTEEQRFKVSGDPTEAAMGVFSEKLGVGKEHVEDRYREVLELPFDSKTKYHAIFYEHKGTTFCAAAGAPEVLLAQAGSVLMGSERKKLDSHTKALFEKTQENFAREGLRVIAFGFKEIAGKSASLGSIGDLTLTGLFGIEDQVRPEAVQAIKSATQAGIKVVMITGDNKVTAEAIAKEAGIWREGDLVVTQEELSQLSEEQLAGKLSSVSIFSRITPSDKMKIIKAYRRAGLVVAMTGDGVNDAPSLVAADLGVAMGRIGTEVAKEAADIVLLDDNLASIVAAVEEGRAMYRNIQKTLLFLFATSLGELLTVVFALFVHMPLPLLAVQILWMNLVTDTFIAMALALDSKEPGLLDKKFKHFPKYFMDSTMLFQMVLVSLVMSVGTLWLFKIYYPLDYFKATTVALTLLAVFQWLNGFNCTSLTKSIFSRGVRFRHPYLWLAIVCNVGLQLLAVYAPFMQRLLKTAPLDSRDWLLIVIVGTSIIVMEELRKFIFQFYASAKTTKARGA